MNNKLGLKLNFFLLRIVAVFVIVAICIVFAVYYFLNNNQATKAAQEAVNVTLSSSDPLTPGQAQTINVKISPQTAGLNISGFELRFAPTPNLFVLAVGAPVVIPDSSTSSIVPVVRSNSIVTYVFKTTNDKLPQLVSVPVTVLTTDNTPTDKLSLNLQVSAIGPIAGYDYAVNLQNKGDFTIAPSLLPSTKPILSPTLPSKVPSPTKSASGIFVPKAPPQVHTEGVISQ